MERSTIHKFCKEFREHTLRMTLIEMERQTGTAFRTISAFENGNSSNLNHIFLYANCCVNDQQTKDFERGLIEAITGNVYD